MAIFCSMKTCDESRNKEATTLGRQITISAGNCRPIVRLRKLISGEGWKTLSQAVPHEIIAIFLYVILKLVLSGACWLLVQVKYFNRNNKFHWSYGIYTRICHQNQLPNNLVYYYSTFSLSSRLQKWEPMAIDKDWVFGRRGGIEGKQIGNLSR